MNEPILQKIYAQALQGVPLLGTPYEAAAHIVANTTEEKYQALEARYVALNGGAGFLFGVPGYALLPLTLPANIAISTLLQLHFCAAVAVLGGEDPADEAVRQRCLACFTGEQEADEGKELVERTGIKLTERGVRLATEQAAKAAGRAVKSLPLLGGFLGAGSDIAMTWAVGERAKARFLEPVSNP